MEHGQSRIGLALNCLDDFATCVPAVDRHYATTGIRARPEQPSENVLLGIEMADRIFAAIDADLADIPCLAKKTYEHADFAMPLVDQLGMKAERRPDTPPALGELRGVGKRLRRVGNGENVGSGMVNLGCRGSGEGRDRDGSGSRSSTESLAPEIGTNLLETALVDAEPSFSFYSIEGKGTTGDRPLAGTAMVSPDRDQHRHDVIADVRSVPYVPKISVLIRRGVGYPCLREGSPSDEAWHAMAALLALPLPLAARNRRYGRPFEFLAGSQVDEHLALRLVPVRVLDMDRQVHRVEERLHLPEKSGMGGPSAVGADPSPRKRRVQRDEAVLRDEECDRARRAFFRPERARRDDPVSEKAQASGAHTGIVDVRSGEHRIGVGGKPWELLPQAWNEVPLIALVPTIGVADKQRSPSLIYQLVRADETVETTREQADAVRRPNSDV